MSQKPDWLRPHGTPWRRGDTRIMYDTRWIRVSEIEAVAPTGEPARYGMVSFKNRAIAVLPIHQDGTVTLVGQNRFPAGDYSWEIPKGGAPFDEDPLDGAKREFLEETGLIAADWREVLRVQLSNSVTDEQAVCYVALDLSPAPHAPGGDETEDLAIVRVQFSEALDAALAGHLPDMLTVAMLLRAYHMAREGVLPGALSRLMLKKPSEERAP